MAPLHATHEKKNRKPREREKKTKKKARVGQTRRARLSDAPRASVRTDAPPSAGGRGCLGEGGGRGLAEARLRRHPVHDVESRRVLGAGSAAGQRLDRGVELLEERA